MWSPGGYVVSVSGNTCTPPNNGPEIYNFTCGDNSGSTYRLTISSLTSSENGKVWKCGFVAGSGVSNKVAVQLPVPVSGVYITRPAVQSDGDQVVVMEGEGTWFVCSTTPSTPNVTISWTKSPSNNLGPGHVNTTSSGGGLVNAYSYLSAAFYRTDQGSTITCTAHNTHNKGSKPSVTRTLDVYFPPDLPTSLQVFYVTINTIVVVWLAGYQSEASQTFHVEYREDTNVTSWSRGPNVDGKTNIRIFHADVTGLKTNTIYWVRVYASYKNDKSQYTSPVQAKTEKDKSLSGSICQLDDKSGVFAAGVAMLVISLVLVLAMVVLVVVCYIRNKEMTVSCFRSRTQNDEVGVHYDDVKMESTEQATQNMITNGDTTYQPVGSYTHPAPSVYDQLQQYGNIPPGMSTGRPVSDTDKVDATLYENT